MKDGWFGISPILSPDYLQYKGPYPFGNHGPQQLHQPPVIAAVVATAVSVGTAGGLAAFSFLGVTGAAGAALSFGSSLALGFLTSALSPKPQSADLSSFASIRSSGLTRQIRQAVTERRLVFGESRVSGPIAFVSATNDNKYLHMIILLATHEVEEIGEVFVNGESITDDMLDVNGIVNDGRFDGKIRIKKHLGTATQLADSELVSEVNEWTAYHRLQGIAHIYVRVEFDRDVFPGGIPNFSAWLKGKKVLDTRDSVIRWSPNLALISNDYLVDPKYGLGAKNVSADLLNAAANTCDEMVTVTAINSVIESAETDTNIINLAGDVVTVQTGDRVTVSGSSIPVGLLAATEYYVIVYQRIDTVRIKLATSLSNAIEGIAIDITSNGSGTLSKIAEPRYYGGGVTKTSAERGNNLEEMLSGMAGMAVYAGGEWNILAGEYQSPTISYSINDLAGGISIETKVSKRERSNRIQGVYISPLNEGNPSDYPAVKNSTYEAQDGEVIKKDINHAFVQRPHMAQRVSKIYLERSRQELVFSAPFDLTGFYVGVGDNFYFTVERYGWNNKIFEVIDWSLGLEPDSAGIPRPIVNITARENHSSVYDWNYGEETAVDPAPNTNLPNAFNVSVVGGFSLDSIPVFTQEQDRIYNILASWETHENQFVASGGKFEIGYKSADETVYKSAGIVDGSVSEMRITALQPDTLYDIRIYAFNNLGVRSQPSLIEGFLVGTTVTTDTEDWENEDLIPEDWENDTLLAQDWES
ncbi:MAG: hypothetical protein COA45_03975 [Zetaproteobacteria bacterium]|nr:MAG: hypothetical protein COA45_03975 [Zetaproteobacteria bacterium]